MTQLELHTLLQETYQSSFFRFDITFNKTRTKL